APRLVAILNFAIRRRRAKKAARFATRPSESLAAYPEIGNCCADGGSGRFGMSRKVTVAALGCLLMAGASAQAQVQEKKFNVVGTWNFLTNWHVLEVPFWNQDLPKASEGKLTANLKSVTELNLKGTEVLRLLKTGVYDFAAALPIYVDDGGAVIEATDIAGVARTFQMSREIVDLWMDEMQKVMKEKHNSVILASFTWPEQNFYCKGDIKSVEDLKGKKIRVQGVSQADLVKGFGASAVTIPFGEV